MHRVSRTPSRDTPGEFEARPRRWGERDARGKRGRVFWMRNAVSSTNRGGRGGWHAGVADCALVRSPAAGGVRKEGEEKRRARNKNVKLAPGFLGRTWGRGPYVWLCIKWPLLCTYMRVYAMLAPPPPFTRVGKRRGFSEVFIFLDLSRFAGIARRFFYWRSRSY